ncbi:MAG: peptide deformylase [Candidatus Pacebacteria bacterium]|nr:peptide deformylase [Candidatus Paceibacterota bacterium]
MNTIKIIKDGDPVLRTNALDVPVSEITTLKIQKIIKDMSRALAQERFGVAIAAPQIGVPLRIFVVAGKVFDKNYGDSEHKSKDKIFINPIILKTSKRKQESHESCLSIQGRPEEYGPDVAGMVERPDKMTIGYYDEVGIKQEYGASSFLSAIFDHEIDHLNGILFIDKAIDQWEIDKDFNKVN